MEVPSNMIIVLENCRISPPPEAAVPENSLPLTFFDVLWLTFHPLSRVIFYEFPVSKTDFTQNIVPNLKTSLSLTLKHFSPFAGNLIFPKLRTNPYIRYLNGDALSLTLAECTSADIDNLFGNHVRDADILSSLVAQLPPGTTHDVSGEDSVVSPVLAIQVTVFPDRGICIGITNSHTIADGSSMFNFIRAWSSIFKELISGKSDHDMESSGLFQLPYYDRSLISDEKGIGAMFLKLIRLAPEQHEKREKSQSEHPPNLTKKVRATLTLKRADQEALKSIVSSKRPNLTYMSSFTVAGAYVWTCFAKTRSTVGKELHDLDETQNFAFAMDCRARIDPPLPAAYFGNCLVPCLSAEKGRRLISEEGILRAAELIGEAIQKKGNSEGGVLPDADMWVKDYEGVMKGEWLIGIAGSPKLDYYNNIDFGWGKAKKFEFVEEPFSLSKSKDSQGDLEMGFIMPKIEMDVFIGIFARGLQQLRP